MSKAVLLSIRPKFCELIANGNKTIEVRKTRPKLDTPFKCYIYCTNDRKIMLERSNYDKSIYLNGNIYYPCKVDCSLNGKVIGEFVCDEIHEFKADDDYDYGIYDIDDDLVIQTCLVNGELWDYGKGKTLYGWHISNLTIYDESKELSKFVTEGDCDCMNCAKCAWLDKGNSTAEIDDDCELAYVNVRDGVSLKPIFRAPQSWCYVEELT